MRARLGFLVAVGLVAGGCSTLPLGSAATPSPPAADRFVTAAEKLRAALPTEESAVHSYEIKGSDYAASGVIDPRDGIAETITTSLGGDPARLVTMTTLMTRDRAWARVRYVPATAADRGIPDAWMRLDQNRTSHAHFYVDGDSDPGHASHISDDGVNLKEISPGRLAGDIDLYGFSDILSDAEDAALGRQEHMLVFTADLDDRGRLTRLSIPLPAAGKYPARTHEIDYGYADVAVPVVPAAADQVAAPPEFYRDFPGV